MTAPHRLSSWKTEQQKARVRALRPLCPRCRARGVVRAGAELDHIVPIEHGGSLADDNTQLLCRECHSLKTRDDFGHAPTGVDANGFPTDPRHPLYLSPSAPRRTGA